MPDHRPQLGQKLHKTLARVRNRGPAEALDLGKNRIREWVSSTEELILMVREPFLPEAIDPRFREATGADAESYERDIGTDSAGTFRARLAADVRCFVIADDDRIKHSSWVTTTAAWTREIRAYMSVPQGCAYIYESFTRADARGQGLYPKALEGILGYLAGQGIREAWVAVEGNNLPSIRAISKAGFHPGFRFRYSRRLGRLRLSPAEGPRADLAAAFLGGDPQDGSSGG